jgi:hypothetical protein
MTFFTLKLLDFNNVTQRTEATPRDISNTLKNWLEIWEPGTPGTLRACLGLYRD